jgi:hypothetical protein
MLTPDLVPEAVYAHLQELFMKVVTGLMTPLMGLVGSDVSQKRVRLLPAHINCNFHGDCTFKDQVRMSTTVVNNVCSHGGRNGSQGRVSSPIRAEREFTHHYSCLMSK